MRIIKSAVAVYICFIIYMIRGSGIPFYSAIAAVLCIQPYISGSIETAKNRTVGTFIGGFAGMLILAAERAFPVLAFPPVKYAIVSLMIVPLIYFAVVIRQSAAAYLSCVVFLSIAVAHAADVNPYLFAVHRIIDTLIGIFVALAVNAFRLPRRGRKDILFIVFLDGVLLNSSGQMDTRVKIVLNRMLKEKALIAFAAARTPATFLPSLAGINLTLPVIALNGAAVYDVKTGTYSHCKALPPETVQGILALSRECGLNCFIHIISKNIMHIYHGDFTNDAERDIYEKTKLLQHKNYIYGNLPDRYDCDTVCLTFIHTDAAISRFLSRLEKTSCREHIWSAVYPDRLHDGYAVLNIYSSDIVSDNPVMYLKNRTNAHSVIAFGSSVNDARLMETASYTYATADADDALKRTVSQVIGEAGPDAVIKTLKKRFYGKERDTGDK